MPNTALSESEFSRDETLFPAESRDDELEEEGPEGEPLTMSDLVFRTDTTGKPKDRYGTTKHSEETDSSQFFTASYWKINEKPSDLESLD